MDGRTCGNCGWNDATVVDEVWGLPAPRDPVPPPPPTVIGPPASPPGPGVPPPPSAAPPPYGWSGTPSPPPQPPPRSRLPLIIGAVVAIAVLVIGAVAVLGGDDESSTTDDTTAETTDETTNDTTEETTEETSDGPAPIDTGPPDPSRDYPENVRTNFLDACEGSDGEGSPPETCLCILEGLETVYSVGEFAALEQQYVAGNEFSETFTEVVAGCQ